MLSSDDEECSTKSGPKRSLALTQPIPKKQKCKRTVTVPVPKLSPVDHRIKPNQRKTTVTVSIDDNVQTTQKLVALLPLVHANIIEKGVSQLKLVEVRDFTITMVKQRFQEIYTSYKKGKKYEREDEDYDSDDPMYDDSCCDAMGKSTSTKSLDIDPEDLFRFIDFIILENRHWDKNYYDTCHKYNAHLMLCPCSKNLDSWRRQNKITSYEGRNAHASFNCRPCFQTPMALEGHIRTLSSAGCLYHYALEQMLKSFRLHSNK